MFSSIRKLTGGIASAALDEVGEFVDNPVGKVVDVVTKPVQQAVYIVAGLTEGEVRLKAIAYLGADLATGMAVSDLIEWYISTKS